MTDPLIKNETTLRASDAAVGRALQLLVVGPDTCVTHGLEGQSVLIVGRGSDAQIRLDDPLTSRHHVKLHVDACSAVEVEDLGSANGTRLGQERLPARERVPLAIGQVLLVGSTTLVLQHGLSTARPRRLWTHGHFEARLEDECARAERSGGVFGVARIQLEGAQGPARVTELLASSFRAADVLACYGPDDYEVLIVDTSKAEGAATVGRVAADLRARGLTVRSGGAFYPEDGRTPEALVAAASAAVRGQAGVPGAGVATVIVQDGVMQRLHALVERISGSSINVLILGETGVGKEVLAEAVHRLSPRSHRPLLRLNCAALSESLLESELFGHEKGAFTGAVATKPGLLETAEGGTIFLDEVGELPLAIQAKLLRVLDARQVLRVGGLKPRAIDVRFVAATNRDLEAEVARRAFRQDLFFRLNGCSVLIPPLRDRVAEIAGLARLFVRETAQQLGKEPVPEIAPEALGLLEAYAWPGNIRELRNVMERATVLCASHRITTEDFPVEKMGATVPVRFVEPAAPRRTEAAGGIPARSFTEAESSEYERIVGALEQCGGNQSRAAKVLGISRANLVTKLDKYGIRRPRK